MKPEDRIYLYDEIGRRYERKNRYLYELYSLYQQLSESDSGSAAAIRQKITQLKKSKRSHPYNKELETYQREEKQFLRDLRPATKKHMQEIDRGNSFRIRRFYKRLFESEKKAIFYSRYTALCYDAEMAYKEHTTVSDHLPGIIQHYKTTQDERNRVLSDLSAIDRKKQKKARNEFREAKKQEHKRYKDRKKELRQKKRDGLISDRALRRGIVELKKRMLEANILKSYAVDEKDLREVAVAKKYQLRVGTRRKIWVMNSSISDIRRSTPVEIEKQTPRNAFAGMLLPGLGQALNGQHIKAGIFAVLSLFIYGIAIPYALGYGNYQGTGISGLITLAEGARRIDRSLIFMIEGVIAVFLLVIAFAILFFSFRDVFLTEKGMIKGIREKNWFESTSTLEQEGFPILVSTPALLIIMFIVMVPIATTILLSFTGMDPNAQSKFPWVGFHNYTLLVTGQGLAGSVFWLVLGWTVVWTIASSTLPIVVGFFLAIFVNHDRIKAKGIFRTIYILPWAVPAFITIMFFAIMFSPTGALTQILSNTFNTRILVRTDVLLSRITLILLQTWLGSSYIFLLFTGVLQAIPGDLYEAAQIDGATAWQKLRRITVPIVLFQTAPLLVGQYTFNFNNFSIIWLFNEGGPFRPSVYGNLAGGTDILASYIFKLVMQNQFQSIGAAISIVVALGLMFFAYLGFKNSKAFKEERL